jgi:hypothetical protein
VTFGRYKIQWQLIHYVLSANPKKQRKVAERNRITAELEEHINSEIEKRGGGVFSYAEIARATGYDLEVVRNICYPFA